MRRITMRLALAATLVATLAVIPAASARQFTKCNDSRLKDHYTFNYHVVAKRLGKRAPGRNIRRYGLRNGHLATCKQIAKSLRLLRQMKRPYNRLLSPGAPPLPPAGSLTMHAGATLQRIAACESGGNPRAVNPTGKYRGKYQFDYGTWASVGGHGDPAAAPEAEQDMRAAILYSRSGPAPWPVCGYR